MKLSNGVDLPEELIQAQREGKLVIFAGTGVSMGEPACLPNFEDLTKKIAPEEEANGRPCDVILGDLEDQGYDVKSKARIYLDRENIRFTPLHKALLELFPNPKQIRIVTTNLDRLFSLALAEISPHKLETYFAPALPLGRDFHGLVYLHGSIEKDNSYMILTDRDFGQAYLTDGWATRFLCPVFENYTVLFIGYSHDDTVMKYLARGLPPQNKKRFVFERSRSNEFPYIENDAHWSRLRILPIVFPYNEKRGYAELTIAVQEWADLCKHESETQVQFEELEQARRIRELVTVDTLNNVTVQSQFSPEDEVFLDTAIRNPEMVLHFVRYAEDAKWLNWFINRPWFCKFFLPTPLEDSKGNPFPDLSANVESQLANWLVRTYLARNSTELLEVILQQHLHQRNPNKSLWYALAWELWQSNRPLDPVLKNLLINLLLETRQPGWDTRPLGWVLTNCRYPDDTDTALTLFRALTRPQISLTPNYFEIRNQDGTLAKVDIDLTLLCEEYSLHEAWISFFMPHLNELALKLEPAVTANLIEAHAILHGAGKADETIDRISLYRYSIEATNPAETIHRESIDILIDAARDIIEALLFNNPQRAYSVIEAWADSKVPILKRLALHGMTKSDKDADDKITWVLDRNWLYALGLKREVFALLAEAFSTAMPETQQKLMNSVCLGPSGEAAKTLVQRTKDYEVYNLLIWLTRQAPDNPLVLEKLTQIQSEHPDFAPREYPEYDMSPIKVENYVPISPFTRDQIYTMEPQTLINTLPTYPVTDWNLPSQDGLLEEIFLIAQEDFPFGEKLARSLIEQKNGTSKLWIALMKGWKENSTLSEEDCSKAFTFLSKIEKSHDNMRTLADLLLAKAQSDLEFTEDILSQIECLSDEIFEITKNENSGVNSVDFFTIALNHTCGTVAEIWVTTLSSKRHLIGDGWQGLPRDYHQRFEAALTDISKGGKMACTILMRYLAFLAQLDTQWVKEKLVPLLDWSGNSQDVGSRWQGYLYGEVSGYLEKEMLPYYKMTFSHLEDFPENTQRLFCKHIALFVVHAQDNLMKGKDPWLMMFVRSATIEMRTQFAFTLTETLYGIGDDERVQLWRTRLSNYWRQRNDGLPMPLAEEEKRAMVRWVFPLEPVFEEVVEAICTTPAPNLPHSSDIYGKLLENSFTTKHAEATSLFVMHLLRKATVIYDFRSFEPLIRRLNENDAPYKVLYEICNQLSRLGYSKAIELADSLKGSEAT